MTLLTVSHLVAGYDRDLPIVKDVSFSVSPGEIVAVLGPNGAGKSTLVKAMAGVVPCFSGRIELGGRDVTGTPAHALAQRGLGFVPQTENIFTRLTIHENLLIASELAPKAERAGRISAIYEMFPDLAAHPRRAAGALSGGQRQMLAAARALLTGPQALMLDEPSAGLSPALVGQVFRTLKRIAESGVALVLVEQNVRAALTIADRGLVLVDGALAHEGPAAGLQHGDFLGRLFLGGGEALT